MIIIPEEAVDAAIDLLDEHGHNGLDCRPRAGFDFSVRAALEAAAPAILAAERERIAQAIEALEEFYSDGWQVNAYEIKASAAGIARGES